MRRRFAISALCQRAWFPVWVSSGTTEFRRQAAHNSLASSTGTNQLHTEYFWPLAQAR